MGFDVAGVQLEDGFRFAAEPARQPDLAEDVRALGLLPEELGEQPVILRVLGRELDRLFRVGHRGGPIAPPIEHAAHQVVRLRIVGAGLDAGLRDRAHLLPVPLLHQRRDRLVAARNAGKHRANR